MRKSLLALITASSIVAGLAAAPMAGAADDYFLKINGISGDQPAGKVKDAIKVDAFAWGAENRNTIGSLTGGAGAGKASFNNLQITKHVDATSPLLFQQLVSGKPINGMELIARKPGPVGQQPIYQRYYFSTVFLTNQQHTGSGESIQEDLTFTYGAVQMTNVAQLSNGSTQNVFRTWNQLTATESLATPGIAAPATPFLF
jgi:type VI secretion system secreted protein Hcp